MLLPLILTSLFRRTPLPLTLNCCKRRCTTLPLTHLLPYLMPARPSAPLPHATSPRVNWTCATEHSAGSSTLLSAPAPALLPLAPHFARGADMFAGVFLAAPRATACPVQMQPRTSLPSEHIMLAQWPLRVTCLGRQRPHSACMHARTHLSHCALACRPLDDHGCSWPAAPRQPPTHHEPASHQLGQTSDGTSCTIASRRSFTSRRLDGSLGRAAGHAQSQHGQHGQLCCHDKLGGPH